MLRLRAQILTPVTRASVRTDFPTPTETGPNVPMKTTPTAGLGFPPSIQEIGKIAVFKSIGDIKPSVLDIQI